MSVFLVTYGYLMEQQSGQQRGEMWHSQASSKTVSLVVIVDPCVRFDGVCPGIDLTQVRSHISK